MNIYILNCSFAVSPKSLPHPIDKDSATDLALSIRSAVKKAINNPAPVEWTGVVDPETGGNLYFGKLEAQQD